MSFMMPLKRRVFHHAFFLELAILSGCRACWRPILSLSEVALRLDDGSMRDPRDLLERLCEVVFRTPRPWDSVGLVRVSAGDGVIVTMSSWPALEIFDRLRCTTMQE
jgi:hypothetical protein